GDALNRGKRAADAARIADGTAELLDSQVDGLQRELCAAGIANARDAVDRFWRCHAAVARDQEGAGEVQTRGRSGTLDDGVPSAGLQGGRAKASGGLGVSPGIY